MRTSKLHWRESTGWQGADTGTADSHLVLYFGSRELLACGSRYKELRQLCPSARILGCSASGQIRELDVRDDEIVALAIGFAATPVKLACEEVDSPDHSRACGEKIGRTLLAPDLAGVFVLSDGLAVNGGNLVAGITSVVGPDVPLTGGLAGDGADFKQTLVGADCAPRSRLVGAIGFYGDAIRIGHGSAGGWDGFGPRRRVTRSRGNVVLELDGQPALDLYERYLDEEEVKGLPGTALRFPLQIQDPDRPQQGIIRTVLGIDRSERSLTFAGDVPEGWMARLMRGDFDHLAAGAADAARQAFASNDGAGASEEVSLIVSCVGRRLLMGQRIIDELDAMGEVARPTSVGFYSYGEIAPLEAAGACVLHNQIVAVTRIAEAVG